MLKLNKFLLYWHKSTVIFHSIFPLKSSLKQFWKIIQLCREFCEQSVQCMFQLWFKPRRYSIRFGPGTRKPQAYNHNDKDFLIEDIPIYIMKFKIFRSEVFTGTIDIPMSCCELFTTHVTSRKSVTLFFRWFIFRVYSIGYTVTVTE